jgi:hypothetical protein
MLFAVCLTAAIAAAPVQATAGDFFPLIPGTKWVYKLSTGAGDAIFEDEVLAPVEIGGEKAFPICSRHEKRIVETIFYRDLGNAIVIVAYDPKLPLAEPRPVFKMGSAREKWTYEGRTPFMDGDIPIRLKGESSPVAKVRVLEKDVDGLKVVLEAELGNAREKFLVSKQTAIYARGIGLVEMQEKSTAGRKSDDKKLSLVEFSPGRP